MSEPASPAEVTQYPLLPLRDVVVFPHMVIPLFVGRPKSIKAMETAMEAGKSILLVAQKSAAKDDPGPEDMYAIGCVSNILQMLKLPDGTVKVLVEGGTRAQIREVVDVRTHWVAQAVPVPLDGTPAPEVERSEEHTSELQSRLHLVCRLLLEKKKKKHASRRHSIPYLICNIFLTQQTKTY